MEHRHLLQQLKDGRQHAGLAQQVELGLAAALQEFQQFSTVELHQVVVTVLGFDLALEVDRQFHYLLLAGASHLLYTSPFLVVH